ncbi:MAG: TetR/AcrR family transcriptional regulator [Anaerolineales bacterium]|nr:MAG: TetR/AcrR family transcriptional regulator [Anaerolineales bacterium]
MPRIVNEAEYTARRNQILELAQQMVYTKGYEQMTIQDILDGLQISKGAFYHYFGSKQALLEALIERLVEEAEKIQAPILQAPDLTAMEKLKRYFYTLGRWKTERKSYLLNLMQVWYNDENALVRQKLNTASIQRFAPVLTAIIHQGMQEGVLNPQYPKQAGEVVLVLMLSLGEMLARALLVESLTIHDLPRLVGAAAAYQDAIERVLGAPTGNIQLFDPATLGEWLIVEDKHVKTAQQAGR